MLLGGGGNGKGTYLNLLTEFIGQENCSHVSLHQLTENRFSMAELYGKLVNIFADLSSSGIKDLSNLKTLTGGDKITAEKKFQPPFDFYNKAKLIFSANKLPLMPEDTDALWRRLILIDFPNDFLGEKADLHILEKLTSETELSGLLNLALASLKEVKAKGGFSYFKTINEVRKNYIIKSNPAKAFIEDQFDQVSDNWMSKDDMYKTFIRYCQDNHLPAIGKAAFGRRIKEMDVVIERQNAWGVHGWEGLKLKQLN